ncbi:hypothetical protein D9M72_544010 [compost metagenome]
MDCVVVRLIRAVQNHVGNHGLCIGQEELLEGTAVRDRVLVCHLVGVQGDLHGMNNLWGGCNQCEYHLRATGAALHIDVFVGAAFRRNLLHLFDGLEAEAALL